MEEQSSAHPLYELHAFNHGIDDLELVIWQLPCPATPHILKAKRVAGLRGRNMNLVEGQVLRRLSRAGIKVAAKKNEKQCFPIDEEQALNLSLLCRVLAPMRNAERMRQVAQNVEAMPQSEAAYWLGMAMYRKNPRRVLSALRLLLTDTKS